jgi:hypothetical protein
MAQGVQNICISAHERGHIPDEIERISEKRRLLRDSPHKNRPLDEGSVSERGRLITSLV